MGTAASEVVEESPVGYLHSVRTSLKADTKVRRLIRNVWGQATGRHDPSLPRCLGRDQNRIEVRASNRASRSRSRVSRAIRGSSATVHPAAHRWGQMTRHPASAMIGAMTATATSAPGTGAAERSAGGAVVAGVAAANRPTLPVSLVMLRSPGPGLGWVWFRCSPCKVRGRYVQCSAPAAVLAFVLPGLDGRLLS